MKGFWITLALIFIVGSLKLSILAHNEAERATLEKYGLVVEMGFRTNQSAFEGYRNR